MKMSCYANVQETVPDSKNQSSMDRMKMIMTRPAFKWTAVAILITLVIITVVLPTVLEVTKQESINGNLGNWTSFSDCSHSCGGGTHFRVRSCDNPNPEYDGVWCTGNDTDIKTCSVDPCPVDGDWGNWTSFSTCSKSCGGGTQTRKRKCDNPQPKYGGADCSGSFNEIKSCKTEVCPVHGEWGSWTQISGCSHSCGGGNRYRVRMCNDPSPSFGGKWCTGNATEFQSCNQQSCPDYKSAFTVAEPRNGPTSGTIKFTYAFTNIGSHYDTSTGQYTCKVSGIYVFSLHIYKHNNYDYAQCYIRKNGSNQILVISNPDSSSDNGYYESSNTVVLHLSLGDRVDLGDCSNYDTMYFNYYWTSFSGFLLKAD